MHLHKKIFINLAVAIHFLSLSYINAFKVELGYASFETEEHTALFQDIINTECFKRLYNIRQYGIDPLVLPESYYSQDYTRAIHSLGVFWLLNYYDAPQEEQIAGLLHDASHTIFSHVGDIFFGHKDGACSYQDEHHLEFLKETDVIQALEKHGLTCETINHKNPHFTCLEQNLPDMCGDRIEYNLAGGIRTGLITKEQAQEIINHLKYENGRWYFTDASYAALFAYISLWHTEHTWGTQMSTYISTELAHALRRAVELNIITLQEILHGTDDAAWHILLNSSDETIQFHVRTIMHAQNKKAEIAAQKRDNKFRGIDPWVYTDNTYKRLTDIDSDFKKEYERVKADSY